VKVLLDENFPLSLLHAAPHPIPLPAAGGARGSGFERPLAPSPRPRRGEGWGEGYHALRAERIDTDHIITLGCRGIPDSRINDRLREESLIFLTHDADFLRGDRVRYARRLLKKCLST
jgi:hypothetical protein